MDKHDAVFAGSLCQGKHYKTFNQEKNDIKWKISYRYFSWKPTFKWGFPPVSISDFHMVVPTQVTPVQIHGGEVEDNLGKKNKQTKKPQKNKSERTIEAQGGRQFIIRHMRRESRSGTGLFGRWLSAGSYLLSRCHRDSPDAVHVGRVSIGESRGGKVAAALL